LNVLASPLSRRVPQYTKAPGVLHGMKLAHLDKSDDAKQQLAKKGIA
jgi:hypothetical protein